MPCVIRKCDSEIQPDEVDEVSSKVNCKCKSVVDPVTSNSFDHTQLTRAKRCTTQFTPQLQFDNTRARAIASHQAARAL